MQLPEHFFSDIVALFGFAAVAIIALLIAYKIFDKMTPKCNFQEELAKGNTAVALALAGLFISAAVILAAVGHAIIG